MMTIRLPRATAVAGQAACGNDFNPDTWSGADEPETRVRVTPHGAATSSCLDSIYE